MARFTLRPLLHFYLVFMVSLTLLALALGALAYVRYFSWHPFLTKPIPEGIKNLDEAKSLLAYFQPGYTEARNEFLRLAKREANNNPKAEQISLAVPSSTDKDLTVDILYLPPAGPANRLIIVSSGVHGIEGGTGSAIQAMMLDRFPKSAALEGTGLLFIHSVNPWGFKNQRRVSEKNIDLGLNAWLSAKKSRPFSDHELLPTIEEILYPQGSAGRTQTETLLFPVLGMIEITRHGLSTVQRMLLQGQSHHNTGLYYQGTSPEPQFTALGPIIARLSTGYRVVLGLDFHTGYGPRGEVSLFPQESTDPRTKILLKDLFEGYTIQLDDIPGYVPMGGGFSAFIESNLPSEAIYLPMVMEYGTGDSTELPGYLRVLQAFVHENQAFFHGASTPQDLAWAKQGLRDILYPSSSTWRLITAMTSRNVLDQAINRFQSP